MSYSRLLRVQQSATRLPADQRAVYEAMFFDNLTPEQVCKTLGITPAELERRTGEMARSLKAAIA